jgi:hypothetical protein
VGKQVDVGKRLEELGYDPVLALVRIGKKARRTGNLSLAKSVAAELLQYTAPKLKSMELSIQPETMTFIDRQRRLDRIGELLRSNPQLIDQLLATGQLPEGLQLPVLKHNPDAE